MSGRKRCPSDEMDSSGPNSPPSYADEFEECEAVSNFKKKKDELEIFMDRMKEVKYEREDVQRKTFGKWMNSMLAKGGHPLVKDLFNDLKDGTKLLSLLEVLTNKTFKREKGKMRVHHLNNVSRALEVLRENNVRLVNISNNDIVDGNAKITLALAWSVFLHWQVNDIMKHLMASTHQSNLEKALISWCQTNTKPYPGVDIKNFSTSWSDGLAFAALIHRWRPEVIDFANIASKTDHSERLDTVFKIAQDVLGIERLLDPEDVNTTIPDKKSVMMYVMCLFQALAHSGLDPPPLPSAEELEEEIKQEVAKQEAEAHKPPSIELTSYQNIVEEVLSWLLIADDRISSMDDISEELNEVKGQFQEHEKFMLTLTDHQGDVGEVLQEGSRLLQESKIPVNEMEEVKVQMKLLNTKWEELRVKAMDRQNKIHEKLMTLQLTELEALKEFLTSTEDRISRMGSPPLDDVEALEENLKEQHELHQDILKQQERVVAFSNLVVVVDENNPDTDFSNMEDQLAALSERWTHICGWTEKRGKLLKQLRTEMPEFHKQQRHLEEWLQMQEKRLKEVEANPNDATQESLMERYDKLQLLQGEMEEKMKEISDLQTSVQTLIESESATTIDDKLSDITTGSKFLDKIEGLQDRWEALSQIMEAQSQRISKYGAQIKCNKKSLSVVSPLIETNVEMVDILSLSRQQDFPKAKRTKIMNEWENSYGQVNEWILRTESLIEVCPGSTTTTFDELSVDEQLILWEDLESEQSENEGVYNQAITDSTALIKYMKQEGQDTFDLEEQVKSMTDKWENVKEVLTNRKLLIDYLLAKKQVQGEIASMTGILAAYEKWLDSQGEVSPISNQPRKLLEQCRVKKKTIHSHESRVNKLKVKSDELLAMESHIGSDEELKTEATNFTSKWNLIVQRLNERLTQLESMDKMSAEEKYTESSQQILQWITGTENFLATNAGAGDEIKLMDLKIMRVQQKQLKEFLVEAKNHEENLSTIQKNSAAPDDLMDELHTRYSEVKAVLEEKSIHLDALILKMEQWLAEMTGLESWLEEVDVFVCAETPAIGDADVLDAQLEQSNALEEDVTTLEPKFTSLNATGKTLLSETDDSLTQIMKARIMKLNSHWTETVRKAKEQNVLLKDAYEKTKQVLRGVSETSEWLTQLSRDAPKLGTINTPADLARLARKFQALKDRVDKREASFRLLNDRGNELLLMHQTQCKDDAKRAATIQELARTFTTLNARWTEITGTVDRNCILLKDASLLYGDFRSKTAQAMDWLDRLEKKLRKSVTSAADVEELSEDIDDIEQYVGNQQEARLVKIQNIGRELIQDGILVNSIQTDVQQLTNRWTLLNQQAQQRKMELEGEMGEAQQWERNVQQLCEWVETTDKILSTRLEHDLSAEDLPNDTEQLSDELVQQEKVLQDMADQVQVYRKANKLEAAARLKEQKDMLQARFEEVQSKFTKFSSPPPESKIYAKIERIWRSLRQVEQALCFLELASEDPESIQGQLNHCTKEYATLSELKRDVEMVLREGRRQVEDKKADVKLSAELDSMKALYNKLGMQIANIRNSLEKGLTVSTQMNEQMSSLELWLEESETQLGGQFQDKNSEMDFLRGRTEELPRWTKIIEEFNRNYDNFLKLVDPVLLDSLKERRFMILQKWETLSQELVKKHEANLKDISLPELEDKQQSVVGELEDWLEKAENFLNKMTNEAVMFSDDEIFELQALNEDLTERSDRLDALRDETIDLIVTKGDPFSVDNPENITLQRLTHRLESIGNQLHEWAGETLKESEEVIVPEVKKEKREVKSFSVQLSSATSSPSGQLKDKEIFAFEVEGQAICATMARMAEKLEEIDQDDDPGRRREALEMELNAVEPEVALTISKGDSLVFKISKSNIHKANQIRAALDLLRSDWIQLKTRAEGQRMAALRLEATQLECQGMMQQLEDWIADSMNTPKSDRKSLQPEWEKKSEEFKILRKKIEELRKRNIRGLNADLKILEDKWKKLEKSFPEHGRRGGGASVKEKGSRIPVPQTKSTTAVGVAQKQIETQTSPPPKQTITNKGTPAAIWTPELVTKVNRLREQVATISRSMAAAEDPMTVKEELEKLSIRVQEMETLEGEGLKGGTSEQMIQGQRVIQKLLDEWATVNMTVGQMLLRSPPSKSPSPSPSPGPKVIGSPESNDILDLEVWLDEIEGMMKEWKTTSATAASGNAGVSGEEAKLKLKEMEAKISKRHRSVMLLMSKKSRMSPANDDSARKIDTIGYRWRNLLAEMTIRRDRLCGEVGDHRILLSKWWEPHVVLRDWIQRATDALEAPVRISDDPSLKNSLSNLKSLEHEMGGKIPDLEKLRQNKRHYVTEEEIQEFREQIDKLTLELPLRRKFVEAKLMSLRKLTSQLDTTTSWVLEVRAQVATAKHRPPHERAAAIESIMIRVEDKGAEVLDVVRNYINLDKECEFNDQFMAPHMVEKIRQLKEDWLYVKSRGEINILTPASDKKFFDVQVAMTPPSFHSTPGGREGGRDAEGNSPTAPVGHTLWSPSPINQSQESSLSELRSTEQKESALLPGHSPQSASAFAFQFTPQATIQQIIKEIEGVEDSMTLNLKCLKQQTVIVGDVEDIRNVLEKQKIVLRELELKKPQLDELMLTAENLKSESTRHNLHGKVSKLREHWTETNEAVIKRKSQLEQCLGDSAHWDGQMKDVDSWLGHMENRLDSLPPLEPSDPHFQQFKNEVQQYKRQVDGLSLMTQRLSASYHQDDTFRIKRAGEQINHRYNQLCTRVSYGPGSGIRGNGYGLGTGGRSSTLPTIDRQLEAQIGWIAERERALDAIESEIQRLGPPLHHPNTNSTPRGNPLQKLKELQIELESHAATVAALGNSGRATASEVDRTPSDAGALLQRLDEMNHRWHALKQRSMAIRSRLESNTEHWHALLLSLREIIEWVIRKDTELIGFGPLAGDVATVQRQIDEHRNFRRQLEGKRPVIETNLISGRQHVANEPVSSDLGSDGDIMDGDARGYRSAEVAARELTRSIRREVTKLNETWLTLLSRSDNWQRSLEDGVMRLRAFQQMLDDGSARLATAEAIKSRWPTIAAAADKSTLLDQLKTFREHISSTQRAMTEINEESGDLMNAGILLGGTNVSRVDDLNVRLKNLQLTVVERETELVASIGAGGSGVASVMAVIPPTSHASVEPPWEKALTPSKVPYYINHENESTQWDHPHMSSLLNSLTVYNDVRFSAYRTALKLRALQKEIRLDKLPLKCVIETFDSLGLRGHNDRLLDVPDMVSTLSTLYSTCSTTEAMSGTMDTVKGPGDGAPLVIPLVTDLAVNWLLNVYDSQRTGQLRNLSFKIGIVLLCKGPMEDKFRYLFRLVADAAKQVDQRKLGLLLHDCMQIPRQLGEVAAFGGSNIEPSVRSCYEKAPKDKTTIQVGHFLEWVKQEPQSLVWLPVLHRIAAAEGARHQAKCNVCKQVPILGLRYRCLKCFNFDMCQRCFFSGKKAKNHKLTHPMQEYCTESTSGEDVRDFTRALKNRFKSKRSLQKHRKLGYLPVQTVLEGDMLESPAPSPQHSLSPEIHSRLPDNYASRLLGDVDGRNRTNSTPDSEDEHSLIAQYCQSLTRGDNVIPQSPIQIVAAIDAEQSEQLEAVIRALEEENASLQAEYERLRHKSQTNGQLVGSIASPTHSDTDQIQNGRNYYPSLESTNENNNILAEARLLRQHKGRLEARMQILEDHNRQLEAQLQRLRQLLDEPKPNSPSKTGTLQSKSVVAAELATDSPLPHRANGHSHSAHQGGWHSSSQERSGYHEESRLPPPPTPGYSVSGASLEDSGHSGKPLG